MKNLYNIDVFTLNSDTAVKDCHLCCWTLLRVASAGNENCEKDPHKQKAQNHYLQFWQNELVIAMNSSKILIKNQLSYTQEYSMVRNQW